MEEPINYTEYTDLRFKENRSYTFECIGRKCDTSGVPGCRSKSYNVSTVKGFALFKISFEFGPVELDLHSSIYERLHIICAESGKTFAGVQEDLHHFYLILKKGKDVKQTCLELFDSIPTFKEIEQTEGVKHDAYKICLLFITAKEIKSEDSNLENLLGLFPRLSCLAVVESENGGEMQETTKRLENLEFAKKNIASSADYKSKLYKKFMDELQSLLSTAKLKFDSRYCTLSPTDCDRYTTELEDMEKRIREDGNRKSLSGDCTNLIEKGYEDGIVSHMLRNGELTLYIDNTKDRSKQEKLISHIKRNFFGQVNPIYIDQQFLKPYLSPGDNLYISECLDHYGTLGMFGWLEDQGSKKQIALTGAHVISAGSKAYVQLEESGVLPLGTCLWPSKLPDESRTNIYDISVIEVDKNISRLIQYVYNESVDLHTDDMKDLRNRKVFKFGATTKKTEGRLHDASNFGIFGEGEAWLVAHKNQREKFAEEGDSGAIVFTKMRENLTAIGVIFGGDFNVPSDDTNFPKNATLVVSLKRAIEKYNLNNSDKIQLDKF